MKDSLPNMDEVVRHIKHNLDNCGGGNYPESVNLYREIQTKAIDWLRLLIEEREQLKSEIERFKSNL